MLNGLYEVSSALFCSKRPEIDHKQHFSSETLIACKHFRRKQFVANNNCQNITFLGSSNGFDLSKSCVDNFRSTAVKCMNVVLYVFTIRWQHFLDFF